MPLEIDSKTLCPCHSKKLYALCCKPLHDGYVSEDVVRLMRSRYAAYALNLPYYIIKTTHKENAEYTNKTALWEKEISQFCLQTAFDDLKIQEIVQHKEDASVTFVAFLSDKEKKFSFREKSFFLKEGNLWLYHSGLID